MVVGVPLGILSAVKRDGLIDNFGKLFAVMGIATPNFWIAIMLIMFFGAILGWLPTYGHGGAKHFVLPAFVLGWSAMAGMVRLGRSSMLEVLDSEYVKFARVKGLAERMVVWKHALKNAVIPLLTFSGLTLAGLLNGSVAVGGGLRLAGHWPTDVAGHSNPGLCRGASHCVGGWVLLHCYCLVGGHSLRLRKP